MPDAVKHILHGFSYPLYTVDFINSRALAVAGGGGAVKTGVPNRIDVLDLEIPEEMKNDSRSVVCPVISRVSGGHSTGGEAVMSLTVCNAGNGSFVATLEGRQCVEYLVRLKLEDELGSPVRENANESPDAQSSASPSVRRRRLRSRVSECSDSPEPPIPPPNISGDSKVAQPTSWEWIKLRSFNLPFPMTDGSNPPSLDPTVRDRRNSGKKNTSDGSGFPTCIDNGGCWLAIGTDVGAVFLFDWHSMPNPSKSDDPVDYHVLKPFAIYPDVSDGLQTGVVSLSLSSGSVSGTTTQVDEADVEADLDQFPLMATICDQPGWSTLHVWRTDFANLNELSAAATTTVCPTAPSSHSQRCQWGSRNGNEDCETCRVRLRPYASASCEIFRSYSTIPPTPTHPQTTDSKTTTSERMRDRSGYRFKHCRFLPPNIQSTTNHRTHQTLVSHPNTSIYLATTVQPLCANRKSISRLVVWSVPTAPTLFRRASAVGLEDSEHSTTVPNQLSLLAEISLSPGQMPACMAVHPNRFRSLIGVGTMDGRVDIYFFSPNEATLTCVYSHPDAHPIFVTALTFVPPRRELEVGLDASPKTSRPQQQTSYEFVSVSVDRALCWHHGPSYERIGRLAHGLYDPESDSLWGRRGLPLLTAAFCLCVISLLPVYVALLDYILMSFV